MPYKWIVWPCSESQGWQDRLEGVLNPRLLEKKEQADKAALTKNNVIEFTRYN
jgi:hypothetical protein